MAENSLSETEELVNPEELSNILETEEFSVLKDKYLNLPFSLLREASIIQSFPLDFKFSSNKGVAITQIGNAVPVLLAKILAEAIYDQIKGS